MKRWRILNKLKTQNSKLKTWGIIKVLLENRGLRTKRQIEEFLNPPDPFNLDPKSLGIKKEELKKAVKRIKKAIDNQESIIVYSDFDADGVCGGAILWETLNFLGARVMPYIPDRIKEGYGLSKKGIDKVLAEYGANLIITADHGVTAWKKVEYAQKRGIDVIISDHHVLPKKLPQSLALIHTTSLSGSGVAWVLAKYLYGSFRSGIKKEDKLSVLLKDHLGLVAIGTIADLIPLIGPARSFVKKGLKELNKTERVGLNTLFKEASLKKGKIGVYEVSFVIAPRLNAMGRLTSAMDSLRLLCTKDLVRAQTLAQRLGQTNRERQRLMEETAEHARKFWSTHTQTSNSQPPKLIFLSHSSYHEGIIGLVAGKLVEEFYRPAVVVSKGETFSKASARSINGFNIVEAIRACSELLIDCGGHPMAAGFTVETKYLEEVRDRLEELAQREISPGLLKKTLKIDCEIDLTDVTFTLYKRISQLNPFGVGNPEPVFASRKIAVRDARVVGIKEKHLKLLVAVGDQIGRDKAFDAIGFNMGYLFPKLSPDKPIDIAYTISLDEWNGEKRLQLKIKDIKIKERS